MNLSSAFPCCTVRALTGRYAGDVRPAPEIRLYYEHFGPPLTLEGLRSDLTALPPGTAPEQEILCRFWRRVISSSLCLTSSMTTLSPGTAYIGWSYFVCRCPGCGIGSQLIKQLCNTLAPTECRRSGWPMLGNPQSKRFLGEKMGSDPPAKRKIGQLSGCMHGAHTVIFKNRVDKPIDTLYNTLNQFTPIKLLMWEITSGTGLTESRRRWDADRCDSTNDH